MAIFDRETTLRYLEEVYKSKYAEFLDDDDDDDEEEDDEDSSDEKDKDSKKNENEKPKTPQHLSKNEILAARNKAGMILSNFPKLKKCCDFIDLSDKENINDDGERESAYDAYYNSEAKAFIKLMDGDVFSGYPDFRSGGSDVYEKDAKEYVKAVNDSFERTGMKAKFMVGPGRDDEAISFGVKSTKEK